MKTFIPTLLAAATAVAAQDAPAAVDLCAHPPASGTAGGKTGGVFGIQLPKGLAGLAGGPKGPGGFPTPPKGKGFPPDFAKGAGFPGGLIPKGAGLPGPPDIPGLPDLFSLPGPSDKFKGLCKAAGNAPAIMVPGPEFPPAGAAKVNRGGSGLYKSGPEGRTDPSLPNHAIYAPLTPPPEGVKLPVIVFSNGACVAKADMFPDLHAELASHGYLVIANGKLTGLDDGDIMPDFATLSEEQPTWQADAITWVLSGAAKKYGNIDTSKIAAMGQSCGGLSSYSTSYHDDRVKLTVLLNSGVIDPAKKCLLKELKAPVAMFLGGPCDVANINGITDYDLLTVPKFKAHLDAGHGGTYMSTNAGKFGQAVVAFLDWQFKGNETQKLRFSDPKSPNAFVRDKWYNITSSYFPHYESKSPYFNETFV